jgi:hypothetical protein
MENLKQFDPQDIDESLARVVTHGGLFYLMFPYISALEGAPHFDSVSVTIAARAATVEDFSKLCDLVKKSGKGAQWFISFSTPWLVRAEEVQDLRSRGSVRQRQ